MKHTAFLTAACRAMHPELYRDPLNETMCRPYMEQCAQIASASFPPGTDVVFPLRAQAALEEMLACRHRINQFVMLGAGMDTLFHNFNSMADPFNFGKESGQYKFFELDLPTNQEAKKEAIASLLPADSTTYIPCDLTKDDFMQLLRLRGYDPKKPALFIMAGLSYYLTHEDNKAILTAVHKGSAGGSAIFLDYSLDIRGPLTDAEAYLAKTGEPIMAKFNWISHLAYSTGWKIKNEQAFLSLALKLGLPVYEDDKRNLVFTTLSK